MRHRVVLVNETGMWGGAEKVLATTARALREKFDLYAVVGSRGRLADELEASCNRVEVIELPDEGWNRYKLYTWGKAVVDLAATFRPHAVYFNSLRSILFASPHARRHKVRVLWHDHNIQPTPARRIALITLASFVPTKIVAVSNAVARQYPSWLRRQKVTVVHNGFPLIKPTSASVEETKRRLGITGNEPIITIPTVLRPWKGHEVFIRAAALVKQRFEACRFIVLGSVVHPRERDYPLRLRRLAAELGISDSIVFLGHIEDVASVLALSTIVVAPSLYPDPFPSVVIEAMQLARPVVASNIGGIPEQIEHGKDGLLTRPGDVEGLARAVLYLLERPSERERIAENGYRRACERFGFERFAASISRVILEAMEEKSLSAG